MANDISAVTPKLLAGGLEVLRANAITSRIVNRAYEAQAGEKGSTIDVPLPSAVASRDVTPANIPPAGNNIAPTTVPIPLNNWKEADFHMTDKDMAEAMNGILPLQAGAAVQRLVDDVDVSILNLALQAYQYHGHGTYVPFNPATVVTAGIQSTADATELRRILNRGLAPYQNREVLVTPEVEANALQLRAFQDQSWSGDPAVLMEGNLNRKLGFRWWMNQNIPVFTAGTITGTVVASAAAAGAKTVTLTTDAAEAANLKVGDLFKFSSHAQVYTVTSAINIGASTSGSVSFSPGLVTSLAGTETISHPANFTNGDLYYNNFAFQRDAVAFASRPFVGVPSGLGVDVVQAVDEVSGLVLRLEVTREHKRLKWTWDILWGVALIRPENAVRLIQAAD